VRDQEISFLGPRSQNSAIKHAQQLEHGGDRVHY